MNARQKIKTTYTSRVVAVGAVAINQIPLDWKGNVRRIKESLRHAKKEGLSVVLYPELGTTGYGVEDAFYSLDVQQRALAMLEEIRPLTKGMCVALGVPFLHGGALYNGVAVIADTHIRGIVGKQHLAGEGVHYEPRWFTPWPSHVVSQIKFKGKEIPVGDLVFEWNGETIGFEICEDAWVPDRLCSSLAQRGCSIILNPSASHFSFGKQEIRKRIVLEGSRSTCATYVHTNLLGCEAGRIIYDGEILIASAGELLVESERFSFKEWTIAHAVIDTTRTKRLRSALYTSRPVLTERGVVSCSGTSLKPSSEEYTQRSEGLPSLSREDEFSLVMTLGLFDYLRKSRAEGFTLSLSGGADSSSLAVLVSMMVVRALNELGEKAFCARISHKIEKHASTSKKRALFWTQKLLTCVYQRTQQSGAVTERAAREVAQAVGARYFRLDVSTLVDGYCTLGEKIVGRRLSWDTEDLALQNIQARVRSPGIWLVANLTRSLLLVTSNRSEAAVGYCTMDGDTSGSIAPLGGIDKTSLRNWLQWVEKSGPSWYGPLSVLSLVNQQAPTAELRPARFQQTDEKDLMPYTVVRSLEQWAIRDKKSPTEVYILARQRYRSKYSVKEIGSWIEKFFALWSKNQWKRERSAPSFHLDDFNLDPKTWCRFPILSAGYEVECEELRRVVAQDLLRSKKTRRSR